MKNMPNTIKVAINGTGFAGDYTARTYAMIPHRNGVQIELAGVVGLDPSISGIRNEFSVITDFAQYDMRVNPNNENELFLPDAANAGNLLLREKLPTVQGTSFPRPNQFYAHGYVNEMSDAVDCVLDKSRNPQSGALMAWDTMAVLMAGYESAASGGGLVDVSEFTTLGRQFEPSEMPTPHKFGNVFQRLN